MKKTFFLFLTLLAIISQSRNVFATERNKPPTQTHTISLSVFGSEPIIIQHPTLLPNTSRQQNWRELKFYKDKEYLRNPLLERLRLAASQGALPLEHFDSDMRAALEKFDACVTSVIQSEASARREGSVEMAGIVCATGTPSGRIQLVDPPPRMLVRGKQQKILLESTSRQGAIVAAQVKTYVDGQNITQQLPVNPVASEVLEKMCLPETGYRGEGCLQTPSCIFSHTTNCLKCQDMKSENGEPLVQLSSFSRNNSIDDLRGQFFESYVSTQKPPEKQKQVNSVIRRISRENPVTLGDGKTATLEIVPIYGPSDNSLSEICSVCPKGSTHNGRNDCLDSKGCSVFTQEFKNGRCQISCAASPDATECVDCAKSCRAAISQLRFFKDVAEMYFGNAGPPTYGMYDHGPNSRAIIGRLPPETGLLYSQLSAERRAQIKNQIHTRLESEIGRRERLIAKQSGKPSLCESQSDIYKQDCKIPEDLNIDSLLKSFSKDLCREGYAVALSMGVPICVPTKCQACVVSGAMASPISGISIPSCSNEEVMEAYWRVKNDLNYRSEAMLRICLRTNDGSVCPRTTEPSIRDIAVWLRAFGNSCANSILNPPRTSPVPASGATSESGG